MGVPHDPEEVIAIVDENDAVVGKGKRKDVHSSSAYLPHRHVQVLVVNASNKILLQFRTNPDGGPPFRDYSAGGHFPYNDDYIDGAVRETAEELGIKSAGRNFRFMFKHRLLSKDGNPNH
jgi:isopentenyldiphosphate isomerase